jgi:NAD(P) transhydrogenase subunit beta
MTVQDVCALLYLVAAVLFVRGLHRMNSPRTARSGNELSAVGMGLAVLTAFVEMFVLGPVNVTAVVLLFIGLAIGAGLGLISAVKVQMTQMPQLVSVLNMVGGGAAAIVALNDAISLPHGGAGSSMLITEFTAVATVLGVLIGSLTFTGSLIAAGKLQGLVPGSPVQLPFAAVWQVLAAVVTVGSGIAYAIVPAQSWLVLLTLAGALAVGVLLVLPIGGADMPVVVSILNACTGIAVAMAGMVISNTILIVAGALVGSAGTRLSFLMAKAMNRSIPAILAGGFGGSTAAGAAPTTAGGGTVKQTDPDDAAIQLAYAKSVIMVPGYGLAAARAQQEMADLGSLLQQRGIDVAYAIHPVAGRMPGHMNVLLAEANVPYDLLKDMDEINPKFAQADVALVVGANDVTNPAANQPGSPIAGMPILEVENAKSIIVIKRGMSHGYAGVDNLLYTDPKTAMLFGDAKAELAALIQAVKAVDA